MQGIATPLGQQPVVRLCLFGKCGFHVFFHPLLGECLKFDVAVGKAGAVALFVKKDHLPVQLPLNLPVRHARRWRPGPGLHHLLAVRRVAHGRPYAV